MLTYTAHCQTTEMIFILDLQWELALCFSFGPLGLMGINSWGGVNIQYLNITSNRLFGMWASVLVLVAWLAAVYMLLLCVQVPEGRTKYSHNSPGVYNKMLLEHLSWQKGNAEAECWITTPSLTVWPEVAEQCWGAALLCFSTFD